MEVSGRTTTIREVQITPIGPPLSRRTGPLALPLRHVSDVRFGRPVFRRITEDETTVQDAPLHPRVTGESVHLLADAVHLVRTTPTTHVPWPSTHPTCGKYRADVTAVTGRHSQRRRELHRITRWPVVRVAAKDSFVPSAPNLELAGLPSVVDLYVGRRRRWRSNIFALSPLVTEVTSYHGAPPYDHCKL